MVAVVRNKVSMWTVLLILLAGTVAGLPSGFKEEGVTRINNLSTITFVPKREGGSVIFAAAKEGVVHLLANPDTSGEYSMILNLSGRVCSNGERGMHQIMPHPDFLGSKRFVYITYTFDKYGGCGMSAINGAVNRLSRFAVGEDFSMDESNEEVLFESPSMPDKIHNGGDMIFGNEGYIYMTIGEGGIRENAKDLTTILGSILRFTEDGDIPADNPFVGDGTVRCSEGNPNGLVCQEIFSYGFRNPYRFTKDPNTNDGKTYFFIGDVGGEAWEEISRGGTDYAGKFYGWPEREGPCALDSYTNCPPPSSGEEDPTFWFGHFGEGAAVTGIAPVPNGLWPSQYTGAVMYLEFVNSKLNVITNDVTACKTCSPPTPAWTNTLFHDLADSNVGRAAQLVFGPYNGTQALYYTTRTGNFNILRITYELGIENLSPVAHITASSLSSTLGTSITFDGSNSTDPEGGSLQYAWDFGDGTTSTQESPSKVFTTPGSFIVALTITDLRGFSAADSVVVNVGDPPVPTITTPAEGSTFAVGDILVLTGSAVDSEGNVLGDSSLTWEVRQHHNTHFHPFLDPIPGNNISLDPAPSPEDFLAATESYLEVLLTVTDTTGYSVTTSVIVMPQMVTFSFDTIPSSMDLLLDGYTVTTPASVTSWVNHPLQVDATPTSGSLSFQGWSNGGDASHVITIEESTKGVTFVATYANSCAPLWRACPSDADCCLDDVDESFQHCRAGEDNCRLCVSMGGTCSTGGVSGLLLATTDSKK
jgi:glucose/arabinose dehydrogenase